MTLHILGPGFSSLVRTVRLYSLEKGLDATFGMTLDGQAVGLRSETHRRLHPFGQLPVLVHDDRHVFETVAICRYLDQVFPPRIASDPERELLVDQWASALATTVDRCLIRDYLLKVAGRKPDPDFAPQALHRARTRVNETLAILEAQLGEKPFLCGAHFSVANALLAPMLDYLERLPEREWQTPTTGLDGYLARIRQRPSGQAVLQRPDFSAV